MKRSLDIIGIAGATVLLLGPAQAAEPRVPAHVECSALSVKPEASSKPAATSALAFDLTFSRGRRTLLASRTIDEPFGQESFFGTVEPYGVVKMSGTGRTADGSSSWTMTFASTRIDNAGGAVMTGGLRDRFGNTRTCKMTIPNGLR